MSKSLYTTIKDTTAPTTATVGVVGQLYLDTSTKTLYQCVEVDTTTPSYTWTALGGVSQEDFDALSSRVENIETTIGDINTALETILGV